MGNNVLLRRTNLEKGGMVLYALCKKWGPCCHLVDQMRISLTFSSTAYSSVSTNFLISSICGQSRRGNIRETSSCQYQRSNIAYIRYQLKLITSQPGALIGPLSFTNSALIIRSHTGAINRLLTPPMRCRKMASRSRAMNGPSMSANADDMPKLP